MSVPDYVESTTAQGPETPPTQAAPSPDVTAVAAEHDAQFTATAAEIWRQQQQQQAIAGRGILQGARPTNRYLRVNLEDIRQGFNSEYDPETKTGGWMLEGTAPSGDPTSVNFSPVGWLLPTTKPAKGIWGDEELQTDLLNPEIYKDTVNIPVLDGETTEDAIQRYRETIRARRAAAGEHTMRRFLDHATLSASGFLLGNRDEQARFKEQFPETAKDADWRAMTASLMVFPYTPSGVVFKSLMTAGKGAFTVGTRAFLNTAMGRAAAARVEAGVNRGLGYLHGPEPTGFMGWLGEKLGIGFAARVGAREAATIDNSITRLGGDVFRVGDELRIYVPKWAPKEDVDALRGMVSNVRNRIIGSKTPSGDTVVDVGIKLVQGDLTVAQYAAKTFGADAALSVYRMAGDTVGLMAGSAGYMAGHQAVPAALTDDPEERDAFLSQIPQAAAEGAAFGAVLGAASPFLRGVLGSGRTYPTTPGAQKLLGGFSQGPAWETALVPKPWRPYGRGGKVTPAGGPIPPTPTGVTSPPLSMRKTRLLPIQVPEPVQDASTLDARLQGYLTGVETAIQNTTSVEGAQRAEALAQTARGLVERPTPDPATGQVPLVGERTSAAGAILDLAGRVGPDRLSRLNDTLGFDLNQAVASAAAAGQPQAVQTIVGQAEWAAGLQDLLDSGMGHVLARSDLPAVVGGATGVPELAGGTARLKAVADAISAVKPGAAVGPPMRLRRIIPGIVTGNVPPVVIQPPRDQRLPETPRIPTPEEHKEDPARAAAVTQQYIGDRSSNLPHPLGVIRYGKPGNLASSEQDAIAVYSDEEGRTLLAVLGDSDTPGNPDIYDATIDGFANHDLTRFAGINGDAEPYFEPSPIAPTVLRLDPDTERLVIDPEATAQRERLAEYYKERAVPPDAILDFEDPAMLLRGIASLPEITPENAKVIEKRLDKAIKAHRARTPGYADAERRAVPFEYDWEVDRELGDLLAEHAAQESLFEGMRLYVRQQANLNQRPRMLIPLDRTHTPGSRNYYPSLIPDPTPWEEFKERVAVEVEPLVHRAEVEDEGDRIGQSIGDEDQAIEVLANQVAGDPNILIQGIVKEQGIQNGMDAINLRKRRLDWNEPGEIKVWLVSQNISRNVGKSQPPKPSDTKMISAYHVRIKDNGIGMSPRTVENAFLAAFGSFAKSSETGGGFGLANTAPLVFMNKMRLVTRSPKQEVITGLTPEDVQNKIGAALRKNRHLRVLTDPAKVRGTWEAVLMDPRFHTETTVTGTREDYRKKNLKRTVRELQADEKPQGGLEDLGTDLTFWFDPPLLDPRLKGGKEYSRLGMTEATELLGAFAAFGISDIKVIGYTHYNFDSDDLPADAMPEMGMEMFKEAETQASPITGKAEGTHVKDMTEAGTLQTDAYDATVLVAHATKAVDAVPVWVLSNGAPQFQQPIKPFNLEYGEKFLGPLAAIVNVKSKVGPNDPRYPFTIDRRHLQTSAQEKITQFFVTTVLGDVHERTIAAYRAALEPNPVLPLFPSGRGIHDPAKLLTPEHGKQIMDVPGIAELEEIMAEFVETARAAFDRDFMAKNDSEPNFGADKLRYYGFGFPERAAGVCYALSRIFKDSDVPENGIVLNPFSSAWRTYKWAQKIALRSKHRDKRELSSQEIRELWARGFAEDMVDIAIHEIGHMQAKSEGHLAQIVDELGRVARPYADPVVDKLEKWASQEDYIGLHMMENIYTQYGVMHEQQRIDNPLRSFINGSLQRSRDIASSASEGGESGLALRSSDGSPPGGVGGRDKLTAKGSGAPGPEGDSPESDFRAAALAHLAAGGTWSSKRGRRLFRALDDAQKFHAMIVRITRGPIAHRKVLDALEPNGWVRRNKFPKYFQGWKPNASMISTLQDYWERRRIAYLATLAGMKKIRSKADRLQKGGNPNAPVGLSKEEIKLLSQMSEESLLSVFRESPRIFDTLMTEVYGLRSDLEGSSDTETTKLLDQVIPIFESVGDVRRAEGVHPSDMKSRDPLLNILKIKDGAGRGAELMKRLRERTAQGLRTVSTWSAAPKNLRWLARPSLVIGPRKQYPTPKMLKKAENEGVFDASPWYDLATGDFKMRRGIRNFMTDFEDILNFAGERGAGKEFDVAMFDALRQFGDASEWVMKKLDHPRWGPFKVPSGAAGRFGYKRTVSVSDAFPKVRQFLDETLSQAEESKIYQLNADAGRYRTNARSLQLELQYRELVHAQAIDPEIKHHSEIERKLGKSFLPQLRKKLRSKHATSPKPATARKGSAAKEQIPPVNPNRVVYYDGVLSREVSQMPYLQVYQRQQAELKRLKDILDLIEGIRGGALRRQGYVPYLHAVYGDEAARELRDPRSVVYQSTTPEIRARFLEARFSDKEPIQSFYSAMLIYVPIMMRMIHLQPAITRTLGRLPTMTAFEQAYTIKWMHRLRGLENPTDALMNDALVQSFIEEPGLMQWLMKKVVGAESGEAVIRESRKQGIISSRLASTLARGFGALMYVSVMGITRVGQLSLAEFGFTQEPLSKESVWSQIKNSAIGAAWDIPRTVGDGTAELASWLKTIAVGGKRFYSEPTHAQVVDIVHEHAEVNPVSGLVSKRDSETERVYRLLTQLYFSVIKGAEFTLRGATYRMMKRRLVEQGWDPNSEETMFWAGSLTNDLIGAYSPRESSPLAGSPLFLWWATFKRFGMAKAEHVITDLSAIKQLIPALANKPLELGTQGAQPPNPPIPPDEVGSSFSWDDEDMGETPEESAKYRMSEEERRVYNETYATAAAEIGTARKIDKEAAWKHLKGIQGIVTGTVLMMWIFAMVGLARKKIGLPADPIWSFFNTLNPLNFDAGTVPILATLDDAKDYTFLRSKAALFGLNLKEGKDLDKLYEKLVFYLPFMRAAMETGNMGPVASRREFERMMDLFEATGMSSEEVAERRRQFIEENNLARTTEAYKSGGMLYSEGMDDRDKPDARYPGLVPQWMRTVLPSKELMEAGARE